MFQYSKINLSELTCNLKPMPSITNEHDIEFMVRHCRPGPLKTKAIESNWQIVSPKLVKEADRIFLGMLDRDLRDCVAWAWIMGFEEPDMGGAMFELGPAEIIRWEWEQFFGNPAKQ